MHPTTDGSRAPCGGCRDGALGSATTTPATPPSPGAYDDAMDALYTALSEARQDDMSVGESRVDDNQAQQQQEEAQERAALQQEQANQAGSGGGFFSDIGHFVSDVVSDLAHGHIGSAFDDGARDSRTPGTARSSGAISRRASRTSRWSRRP